MRKLLLVNVLTLERKEVTYSDIIRWTGRNRKTLADAISKYKHKYIEELNAFLVCSISHSIADLKRLIDSVGDLDGEVFKRLECGFYLSNHGRYKGRDGRITFPSNDANSSRKYIVRGNCKLTIQTHNEVYRLFVGDIPNGYKVYHKDANPMNCKADNLVLDLPCNFKKYYNFNNNVGVFATCIDTGEVEHYDSITECAKELFLSRSTVTKALKENRRSCGYIFERGEEI